MRRVRRWRLAALLALGAAAGSSAAPQPPAGAGAPAPVQTAAATGVRGKVLFEGKPAAGVRLLAFADAGADLAGAAQGVTGPTGDDGQFLLGLEAGRYFLVATRTAQAAAGPAEGDLFGYYGGNPVRVSAGALVEANLQLVRRGPLKIANAGGPSARIEGIVTGPRGPEQGASLFAYPGVASGFRGPDLTGPLGSLPGGTGPDGRFSLELPPGTYYLTAARRKGGAALGPLQTGDLFGYFDGNPLRLAAGDVATVVVQVTEKLRAGDASAGATAGATGIRGRIHDPAGAPVAGVFAFATPDQNLIGTMPPHRSRPVGPDGSYFIELPGGGTYYVGARTGFGGPPQPGQWQGMLGDANVRAITVAPGAVVDGVDITVRVVE